MRRIRVQALKNQAVIADKCHVAECFIDRLRGLIGRRLEPDGGLLLPKCSSIHMWFMKFPIDVVFVKVLNTDNDNVRYMVTSVHASVKPWKALPLSDWKATDTLELPEGTVARSALIAGDELCTS